MNTSYGAVVNSFVAEDQMASVFCKIALLLLTGVSCHYSLTPPHIAKPKTIVAKRTLFERGVQWVTFCSKAMVWMMTMSDVIATYLTAYYRAPTSFTCPHRPKTLLSPPSAPVLLTVSPMLVAGACAVAFANLLRQRCFRELGPLFTFEVAIQPNHKLVTTGPYAVVRHPSYIGIYLTLLGSTLVGVAPGSWLRECWFSFACSGAQVEARTLGTRVGVPSAGQVIVSALVGFWLLKTAFVYKSTYNRLQMEDQELHRVFGKTWEEYARRVRWRILPGIY